MNRGRKTREMENRLTEIIDKFITLLNLYSFSLDLKLRKLRGEKS